MKTLTADQKRKITNFKCWLARQKNRRNKAAWFTCRGGPLHGQKILLDSMHPVSAVFTVNDQTGYYNRPRSRDMINWTTI